MSDYNFQVFTPAGGNAISRLYNSYYILSRGSATPAAEAYSGIGGVTKYRPTVTITAPATVNPYLQPLLLLKNNGKTKVGCYQVNMVNGVIVSWKVIGDAYAPFDYAIAVSENGVVTPDKYGMQILAPDGVNILFDSRRTNNLIYKGWGGITSGFINIGQTATVGADFTYFTAPMVMKNVYEYYGVSGGVYSYFVGTVCMNGNGGRIITFNPVLSSAALYPGNIGDGGSASTKMLFFLEA